MALQFRNLDITPDAPVDEWGVEGLLAAIDRGDLSHWQRIVRAIRRDPHGSVSVELDQALDLAEDSGVERLMRDALERAREGMEGIVRRNVDRYIRRSGVRASEFARRIGTSPSRLSTYRTGKVVPSAVLLLRMEEASRQSFL